MNKSRGTILVVDDTPANLKLLVDTLTAAEYEVLPADSGALALAAVAARRPDLILLDVRMPGMDGFEVCRRLKAQTETWDIPIIFVSAFGESAERVQGLELGAVDFVAKPIQPDEMLARVHTHLKLRRLRIKSDQDAAELRQANQRYQSELAEHRRAEAALLVLTKESQAANLATLKLIDEAAAARDELEARFTALAAINHDLESDLAKVGEAEMALVASELRYRRLFETAKDGILILDAQTGMVVDVNPFLVEILGFSREVFLGKTIWDLGFFRDIVANQASFAELQANEFIRYHDKPLETADGRRIDVEFVSNVYRVNNHKVIQCNIRDITARKRVDEELRTSLREKVALLNEVHHRVRNNLQVISSLLRMEAAKSREPGTQAVLRQMQGRIRSMALLHETLCRSGNFARVNLADYLRQVATQVLRGQQVDSGAVRLELDLEPIEVEIDVAIPCGFIVNELATNCLKYGFPGGCTGEVLIALQRCEDGRVRLQVSDTGVGLPADLEHVRKDSLGLTLVADLAGQLEGTLEASPPGPGSVFTVTFNPVGRGRFVADQAKAGQ